MDMTPAIEIRAQVRVERGTAGTCACGGRLDCLTVDIRQPGPLWRCADCGREYA